MVEQQEVKIIRVFFKCFDEEFCIDRPYDNGKNDQENCDGALQTLIGSMAKDTIVPALKIIDKKENKGQPVFMNLNLVPYVSITNVAVYTAPQQAPTEQPLTEVIEKEAEVV